MADRYHVIIVDKSKFSMEDYNKEGKNEYNLYECYEEEDYPDGVSLEVWLVEDGEEWKQHPLYEQHFLVQEDCYLIDWEEIGTPYMVKPEEWWKEKLKMMRSMYNLMSSIYPVADPMITEIQKILDPDGESIHEAMEGESYWPDSYTLGHWIYQVESREGPIIRSWSCESCSNLVERIKIKFFEVNEEADTVKVLCIECFKRLSDEDDENGN